jgi:hypothetical protein
MAGEMSAEAKKLIELTSKKGGYDERFDPSIDVGAVLEAHPELLKGMREYMEWRDAENKAIAETKESAPLGHEMSGLLSKIAKKRKKKKRK